MANPSITIILTYYNDKLFLKDSIESILNQDYQDFKVILINHASTDGSRHIARSYKDKRILHIDRSVNYGAGSGYNLIKCLPYVDTKYVKLFCADDIMVHDCLSKLIAYMEKNPHKGFAFGDAEYIDREGKSMNIVWSNERSGFSKRLTEIDLLRLYFNGVSALPFSAHIIKAEFLKKIIINKTCSIQFDMNLWLSLLLVGAKIGFLDDTLAYYRIHDGQYCSARHEGKIISDSLFECYALLKTFTTISNIRLIKKLFNDSIYIKKLKYVEDIPFIVAVYGMNYPQYKHYAYSMLYEMIEDDKIRDRLLNRFNFGIKEFRELYFYKEQFEQIIEGRASILSKITPKKIIKYILPYGIVRILKKQWRKYIM
jgi:glycosyltransferase involved in cell wall biosynthesis